jgi:hypothetical protein
MGIIYRQVLLPISIPKTRLETYIASHPFESKVRSVLAVLCDEL